MESQGEPINKHALPGYLLSPREFLNLSLLAPKAGYIGNPKLQDTTEVFPVHSLLVLCKSSLVIDSGCRYEVLGQNVLVQTCQVIFTVASVLGSVACLSSLLLLWACLQSGHPHSLFRRMHLPPIPYAKIITMIYLKVRCPHF